jgi:excisionase family DNA binding protein
VITRDNYIFDNQGFLTPEEVAKILRVNVLTVYGYIRNDSLNAVRLGRNYRIARRDFAAFVESKRTQKTGAVEKRLPKEGPDA